MKVTKTLPPSTSARSRPRGNKSVIVPVAIAVLLMAVFQAINPSFLSYHGIISLVYAMSYFLIAACGLTFVIMTGSFDFSVVSVLKLAALLCALYIDQIGLWVVPLALLVSLGIGFVNGVFVAKFRVPSFMATLSVSVLVEGIALYLSKGFLHIIPNGAFRSLSTTFIFGLPSIFYWAMAVWLASTFVALSTPFGRRVYAVGGNAISAALSGINVERYRIYVFMLCSLLCGLAGVLYMANLGGGSTEMGADAAIPLFAAVVAGGTALVGGIGGPHRTLLGVIIITWIQAGLLMLGFGQDVQVITFGIIAVVTSIITIDRRRIKSVK